MGMMIYNQFVSCTIRMLFLVHLRCQGNLFVDHRIQYGEAVIYEANHILLESNADISVHIYSETMLQESKTHARQTNEWADKLLD